MRENTLRNFRVSPRTAVYGVVGVFVVPYFFYWSAVNFNVGWSWRCAGVGCWVVGGLRIVGAGRDGMKFRDLARDADRGRRESTVPLCLGLLGCHGESLSFFPFIA
jgi:hypothetical protein